MRITLRALGLAVALTLVVVSATFAAYILGTSGPDKIGGTDNTDTIRGGPGADVVWGRGRADRLYGGSGDDTLMGDWGNDWIHGSTGNDSLIGTGGIDHLYGEEGDDTIWVTGDGAPDFAYCGIGIDTVYFDYNDTVAANCENKIGPIAHRNN